MGCKPLLDDADAIGHDELANRSKRGLGHGPDHAQRLRQEPREKDHLDTICKRHWRTDRHCPSVVNFFGKCEKNEKGRKKDRGGDLFEKIEFLRSRQPPLIRFIFTL